MGEKQTLRAHLRAQPADLVGRERASVAIGHALVAMPEVARAAEIALFAGIGHEPDTEPSFHALTAAKRWFPVVTGPRTLGWAAVERWTELVQGRFGLLEPPEATHTEVPRSVDVVLVPGLAFDRRGARLGWGHGFYDRALQDSRAFLVGVCVPSRLFTRLPACPHDVVMHAVVTSNETLRVGTAAPATCPPHVPKPG